MYPGPNLTRISGGKEQSWPLQVRGSALTRCHHAEGMWPCPFWQNKHQIQSYPAPTSNPEAVGKEAMSLLKTASLDGLPPK